MISISSKRECLGVQYAYSNLYMSSGNPPSRLADYFFVVGIHDRDIIPKYEAAKSAGGSIANESYFNIHPTESQQTQRAASLDNTMLDHVATVIQNFDKDRDMARDTVIAIWDGTGSPGADRRKSIATATNAVLKSSSRRISTSVTRPSSKSVGSMDIPTSDLNRILLSDDQHPVSGKGNLIMLNDPPVRGRATCIEHTALEEITRSPSQVDQANDKTPNIFETKFPPSVLLRYPNEEHSPRDAFPSYVPIVRTMQPTSFTAMAHDSMN